ncbi:MAG: hypothetical protein WAV76_10370 [Bacteroidota bacterium]
MKVSRSSRHAKIVGDFGEALVLYWLSKYGYECARIDYTGIDLIARNPHKKEVMGISVKSRTRTEGTESDVVNIPIDNFEKAKNACHAFGCVPYFAIVVDAGEIIRGFVLSMDHLLKISPPTNQASYWKMNTKHLEKYRNDSETIIFAQFSIPLYSLLNKRELEI